MSRCPQGRLVAPLPGPKLRWIHLNDGSECAAASDSYTRLLRVLRLALPRCGFDAKPSLVERLAVELQRAGVGLKDDAVGASGRGGR